MGYDGEGAGPDTRQAGSRGSGLQVKIILAYRAGGAVVVVVVLVVAPAVGCKSGSRPGRTTFPSAMTTELRWARLTPSLCGQPTIVTLSPIFSMVRFQLARARLFGLRLSNSHCAMTFPWSSV